MDLNFAGIACREIRARCNDYYQTTKTKVQAFCRNIEKSDVYQSIMGKARELGEGARALLTCIFSRKTTETEVTRSIRKKGDLAPGKEKEGTSTFAENVRAQAKRREEACDAWFYAHCPVKGYDGVEEFLEKTQRSVQVFKKSPEALREELLGQQDSIGDDRTAGLLIMKKMALLNDISLFKASRATHFPNLDSAVLANDLFNCQSGQALKKRIEQADVPKPVQRGLKAKLNKVQ